MNVTQQVASLNDAQQRAVTAKPGNYLVLAGAGSGKTRVLVNRVAWLVSQGESPYSIMAVTFTNKAAAEMRARIEALWGSALQGLWVGTFHSLAHRLLRAHWRDAGLPDNFQILDSDDQLRLIKRICKELELDDSRWPPRQVQWFINGQKDEGLRPQHIETHGDLFTQTMVRVYERYEQACQRGGMVDFAELLLRAHELLRDQRPIREHYQRRFSHLLVDEFQDTNAIQYAWLRLLAGEHGQVMAVGDDDQSIYGWRGARIENIRRFDEDFAGVETIRLEQNYRSTSTILRAANELIRHNTDRLGKELWTEGDEGEPIQLYAGFNEHDEARFIVDRIQEWLEQGYSRSDVAILYRSNAQSRVLEEALIRAAVPYRIYGGQRFFDRAEIKNALAYLRLLNQRDDDASLERVINVPTRGIGERSVQLLRDCAREQGVSLWQACRLAVEQRRLPARACGAVADFMGLLDELEVRCANLALHELVDHVIAATGLIDFHRKEKGERGQARVENLEELVSATRQFDPEESPYHDQEQELAASPLAVFLDHAALEAGDNQADRYEESVQLMTLHSAKGLEFPLVFMSGVEEGLFPHKMSLESGNGLEEERRLCYVGITRAMQRLYLCYAESRRLHGSETLNAPSRFIGEIPRELIQEVRLNARISRPVSQGLFSSAARDVPEGGFALGQRVLHKLFGEGVILNYEGQGAQARVQVNFDTEGTKWLVLSYAKLQAL
ncbi:DNA helicase II [Aestuariirhabdus litorea]|uniref:DNA 3'-5' helicase n=1 Tax=Aestuariirhabdus litorea TaxID=2528527 RepID=A0A3P3VIE6_9GAMM|nr:DNA helicase II [Aestuariirhabdus litorea]RRJ82511.1 DNA helicase II [Aestuariirhabdus litorea]RWW92672.1 DNA helicase II [Endozoicomonadaceae bacterium GTF-13]